MQSEAMCINTQIEIVQLLTGCISVSEEFTAISKDAFVKFICAMYDIASAATSQCDESSC